MPPALRLPLAFLSLVVAAPLWAAISYPAPTFAATGVGPTDVAVADFDGDCDLDFATADQFSAVVTVRFGNGTGGFPTASTISGLFSSPQSIVTADFDNDGTPDLAVGNNANFPGDPIGPTITVLLNDGGGTFTQSLPSPATSGGAKWMAAADINEDGDDDLFVSDPFSLTNGVRLYLGNGDGTFAASTTISTDTHMAGAMVVVDFNGDDNLDLAVVTFDATALFLGNGDGTFGAPAYHLYANPDASFHIAAADIDADGDMDFATAAGNVPGGATVFINDGSATFTRTQFQMPPDANPIYVALADLDGDGNIDIVTANQFGCTPHGSNLTARPGNGDGTFGARQPISVGYGPTCVDSHWQPNAIAAVDLNCDGAADMIVANLNKDFASILLTPGAADTTDPVVTAPPDVTVPGDASCSAVVSDEQLGTATATDNCSECVTIVRTGVPPGNVFPPGDTIVTYTATDGAGNSAAATQTVTVTASLPSITGAGADPSVLWPPNHKMVNVTVDYTLSGGCGSATCAITSITSDEPVDGLGDGDAAPDWEIVDEHHVRLRAERSGTGDGRVYTITITCSDGTNSATQNVLVTVPKSQK